MNFFSHISIVFTLLVFMQQCGDENISKGTPACVKKKIIQIVNDDVWNPPAKIYSYVYDGREVYFIPQRCCDIPSELYDEDCKLICNPDGGFSGGGDGRCRDFFDTRTNETLVWEDKRDP